MDWSATPQVKAEWGPTSEDISRGSPQTRLAAQQARVAACPETAATGKGRGRNPPFPPNLLAPGRTFPAPKNIELEGKYQLEQDKLKPGFSASGGSSDQAEWGGFAPTQTVQLAGRVTNKDLGLLGTGTNDVPADFNINEVGIKGNYLQTCQVGSKLKEEFGCVRVSFKQSAVKSVSIFANTGTGGVLEPAEIPASWGCGKQPWAFMSTSTATVSGKAPSDTVKAAAIKAMKENNSATLNLLRVIGVLGAWFAIFCCLYPIVAFFDIMEDYMSMIPLIGGCLSTIGHVIEWAVTMVVCCMSCSIGCSCAFFVIALVWVFMRPEVGVPMMIGALVLFGIAWGVLHMAPKKDKGQARDLNVELNNSAEGSFSGS